MPNHPEPGSIESGCGSQTGGAEIPPLSEQAGDAENKAAADAEKAERTKRIAEIGESRRRERRKASIKYYAEVVGALATAVVAILTAFYVYYSREQLKTLTTQTNATRDAANAAADSAKASQTQAALIQAQLEAGQRPRLDIQEMELGSPEPESPGSKRSQPVIFSAENFGHGAAFRVRAQFFWYKATFHSQSDTQLPASPIESMKRVFFVDLKSVQGKPVPTELDRRIVQAADRFKIIARVPGSDWDEAVAGPPPGIFSLYGWIDYCDSLNIVRRDAFCWRFTGHAHSKTPCDQMLKNIPNPPTTLCH